MTALTILNFVGVNISHNYVQHVKDFKKPLLLKTSSSALELMCSMHMSSPCSYYHGIWPYLYMKNKWASVFRNLNFTWGITLHHIDFYRTHTGQQGQTQDILSGKYTYLVFKRSNCRRYTVVRTVQYYLIGYFIREFFTIRNSYLTRMENFWPLNKKANSS